MTQELVRGFASRILWPDTEMVRLCIKSLQYGSEYTLEYSCKNELQQSCMYINSYFARWIDPIHIVVLSALQPCYQLAFISLRTFNLAGP